MPLLRKLRRMSEDISEEELERYDELRTEQEEAFAHLMTPSAEKDVSHVR